MTGARILSEAEAAANLEPFGGVEAVLESLRRFGENEEYFEAHRDVLTSAYPDEWVCIVDRRVAAHAGSPEEALRLLDESGKPRDVAFMGHLPTEPVAWLL